MSDTKPSTPEYRAISSLHNWENNPRTATKDGIERLIKQIKKLGVYKPLIITEDGTVLGGNMRLKALGQMGEKKVWVSVVQADTEEKKIEYALSDNDRVGKYEGDQLANLIGKFPEVDWGDYSVDIKEPELVSDLMDSFKEVEEDEPPLVETGPAESKLGEIYQLGRHRVMCGDSTKIEDVEKLMDGKKADMVFTDPPYNVSFMSRKDKKHALDYTSEPYEDDKTPEEWNIFMRGFFSSFSDNLKDGGCFYVWGGNRTIVSYYGIEKDFINLLFHQIIVWDKDWSFLNRKDLLAQMELCLYGWKRGKEHYFDRQNYSDIWKIKKENPAGMIHSAQKPIELCSRGIKMSSKQDDIVLDLFLGSGSTLIACEQTNRINFGLELDPRYIDVIIKRWMKFTGQRASKTIDADGKPCNIPVKFADESFMESKTSRANSEVKKED